MVADLELLDAWIAGDQSAAEALLERHLDPLARFFRGKVAGEVEDFVQETLMRGLARRDALAPGSSVRAYLYGIARNVLYEHYRKAPRQTPFDPQQLSLVDLAPTPSAALHHGQQQQLMMEALRRIPIDSRVAIELFYWEELGIHEMASVLEVPVGTVKSRLHRARGQLKTQLETLGQADPALRSTLTQLEVWERRDRGDANEP